MEKEFLEKLLTMGYAVTPDPMMNGVACAYNVDNGIEIDCDEGRE